MSGGFNTSCDEDGVCTTPLEMVLRQVAYSVGPSASTGGFICAALALALRAHETFVRDRAATAAAGGEGLRDMTTPHFEGEAVGTGRASEATPSPVHSARPAKADELGVIMPRIPATPRRSRSVQTERDYSLFMPPGDGDQASRE